MSEAAELARSLERNFAAERVGVHLPIAPATAALDELAQANARLKELEAAAAQAFPLTAPQAAELLAGLSRHVAGIAAIEKEGVFALTAALD